MEILDHFSDVNYRKLNNLALKKECLCEKHAFQILRNKCHGIDAEMVAKLKPCLIKIPPKCIAMGDSLNHSYFIHRKTSSLFYITFFSRHGYGTYALGFDINQLAEATLMFGYDDCNEVRIFSTSERNILQPLGILLKKTRNETRINAIKILTKGLKNGRKISRSSC